MKKVQEYIAEYLKINIQEARGAVLVFVLLVFVFLGSRVYSSYTLGEASKIAINTYGNVELPEQEEFYKKNYTYSNEYSKANPNFKNKPVERFNFNPNDATDAEFNRLGFPPYLTKIIINYRSKGGKFKYKEDLLRIYAMKPEIYAAAFPLMTLPSKTETSTQKDFQEEKAIADANFVKPQNISPQANAFEKTSTYKKKDLAVFDLNMADTTQLMALNGIGRGYANRIIKFRDGLGGFYSLDQVSETYGLPPELMTEIRKRCTVSANVKKIYINKTDFIKHPYVKYNIGKAIVNYRKQHGNFKNAEDLKNIIILDQQTIDKIKPYLDFSLP